MFIKSELKVGVVYVKEGQYTEEEILDNNDSSILFDEFTQILGDKIRLKGKYALFTVNLQFNANICICFEVCMFVSKFQF